MAPNNPATTAGMSSADTQQLVQQDAGGQELAEPADQSDGA